MKIVTLDVRTPGDAMADFTRAWETGKPEGSARISFATPELLWRVLTDCPGRTKLIPSFKNNTNESPYSSMF
ncbi:hypothetical protein JCM12296A_46240 [Desulfosarcina cetonica]|uniref:hypothetical protein n=1 Tax=Desulfosarcina cetonica TaxID=90730 RepID=UPI001FEF3D2E|nr:hypothetical protein [Desulfosarcina cetonica]